MTADKISRWLRSPQDLPDTHDIHAATVSWPWFVPLRMMAAARQFRQEPADQKSLDNLRLYGGPWTAAYTIATADERKPYQELKEQDVPAVSAPELIVHDEPDEKPAVFSVTPAGDKAAPLIQPVFTEDYFRHEGVEIDLALPDEPHAEPAPPQTLMVMMSFAEWLNHFKVKTEKDESEAREQRALRSMWQQEKLAAALGDEPDEIPEEVFEMAVSSITREDDLASESLAAILEKQEKWSAAADMYRKLALRIPAKSGYFAARADAAKKRLQ